MSGETPTLTPLNRKTRRAAPYAHIEIREFPFRIGRESRLQLQAWKMPRWERRQDLALPNNDLCLEQVGKGQFISREHLQIEERDDGTFLVVDRGSICGTTVGDTFVGGGGQGGSCRLRDGDTLVLGPPHSCYRFRFELQPLQHGKRTANRRHRHAVNSGLWLGLLTVITAAATVAVHGFML
ncbi:MAG: FHA domain-containing protein [Kiritimatiellia bacterium]|jgi:hypothetical protein|nr:FHA domain-containing protein [Kiritimatiellia bacterium]MDP6810837.1 FHA domain-containing protein [Kiritimatiellia bacterium]MDP7024179.1 FHA domain-containing protein [Kiritimatiellia bacterium]